MTCTFVTLKIVIILQVLFRGDLNSGGTWQKAEPFLRHGSSYYSLLFLLSIS
ncbi:hypothetical protein GLYMA_18G221250v4 [Glycine max]|nr:hypothetical protein GLYMA_18G221250v4 [Glycine max]KAH1155622.1 hypothetical protein GYH30_050760 [Glycine max]